MQFLYPEFETVSGGETTVLELLTVWIKLVIASLL